MVLPKMNNFRSRVAAIAAQSGARWPSRSSWRAIACGVKSGRRQPADRSGDRPRGSKERVPRVAVVFSERRNRRAASGLQASPFRSDVTVFRLNARPRPKTGSDPAFGRNAAARVYRIEAAHNPRSQVQILPPLLRKALETGPFSCGSPALCPSLQAFDTPVRPWCDPGTWLSTAQLK